MKSRFSTTKITNSPCVCKRFWSLGTRTFSMSKCRTRKSSRKMQCCRNFWARSETCLKTSLVRNMLKLDTSSSKCCETSVSQTKWPSALRSEWWAATTPNSGKCASMAATNARSAVKILWKCSSGLAARSSRRQFSKPIPTLTMPQTLMLSKLTPWKPEFSHSSKKKKGWSRSSAAVSPSWMRPDYACSQSTRTDNNAWKFWCISVISS